MWNAMVESKWKRYCAASSLSEKQLTWLKAHVVRYSPGEWIIECTSKEERAQVMRTVDWARPDAWDDRRFRL